MPEVSIIIPVYNGEAHLAACLDAVCAQNHPDYEIIVVDDCSVDRSTEIAGRFPVRVVRQPENRGAAAARNRGAAEALADTLVFLDSDVRLPEDAISRAVTRLKAEVRFKIVLGEYSENSRELGFVSDYKNLDLAYRGQSGPDTRKYISGFFFAIARTDYEAVGGFDEQLTSAATEDIDFGLRICRGQDLVYYDRNLRVNHMKTYTLHSMLCTNYARILNMVRIRKNNEVKLDVSAHTPIQYFLNIFIPATVLFLGLLAVAWSTWWLAPMVALLLFFAAINLRFFTFLFSRRGLAFTLGAYWLMFLEYAHVFVALLIAYGLTFLEKGKDAS